MDITANSIKKLIKTVLLTGWLLLLMLPARPILAQQSDTTSFFPFETGDIWVYDRCPTSCGSRLRIEIIQDSTNKEKTRWLEATEREAFESTFESTTDTVEFKVDTAGNVYMKPLFFENPHSSDSTFALALNDTVDVDEPWIAQKKDSTVTYGKVTEKFPSYEIFKDTTQGKLTGYSTSVGFIVGSVQYFWAQNWGIVKMRFGVPKARSGISKRLDGDFRIRGMLKGGELFGDTTLVSVSREEEVTNLPEGIRLHQNYPNPFNPSTTIRFDLRRATPVSLAIYDITGREITTLLNQQVMSAGRHQMEWNAGKASSGIYFYRLEVNGKQITRKMMLIK